MCEEFYVCEISLFLEESMKALILSLRGALDNQGFQLMLECKNRFCFHFYLFGQEFPLEIATIQPSF
uniref:Uncharacterized protein n=1 Tax=Rhizophora mucronata TaxID=61149 RepID=A0A2P2NMH2_RHIMU